MGYFAVLGAARNMEVVRCHVNLWVVGGLLGDRFFFDIGLGLRAKPPPAGEAAVQCTTLRLALPFSVLDEHFEDLSASILNQRTASLVFGQPVTVTAQKEIRFSDRKKLPPLQCAYPTPKKEPPREEMVLHVRPVTAVVAETDQRFSGDGVSVWTVSWTEQLTQGDETYIRMRFRVKSFARAWASQASGALLDLRVCDFRESGVKPEWDSLAEQMLLIKELNMFVIVPANLKQRAASPIPKYVRLLEGSVWEAYLGRTPHVSRRKKLCIYYWRGEGVDATTPFRAFLDLEKDSRRMSGLAIVAAATVAASMAAGATYYLCSHATAFAQIVTWLGERLQLLIGLLTVGLVWQTIKWLSGHWTLLGRAAKLLRAGEDLLYKTLVRSK